MTLKPTTLAIPLYFILIGIELIMNHYQKRKLYRLNDSITNINAGASQQVVGILMKLVGISLYEWIYLNFALTNLASNWYNFIILFMLYDLCYYWAHRLSHEINLFWSAHVVHHQSEEYNLSVALRQSWFQAVWTAPVYLPLALMGFNPIDLVFVSGINLIYQFWIHTEIVGKMGFLEYFMNTPSHHRVHHGRNPKYIDKNHAGVFIIWDKMFGTFQPEEEKPVYGITTPVNSWNPVWANFAHFKTIGSQLKESRNFIDVFKTLFYKPGWSTKLSAYVPIPEVTRETTPKYNTIIPQSINLYLFFQYLLATVGGAIFLFKSTSLSVENNLLAGAIIVSNVAIMGLIFEGKKWAYLLEFFRLLLTALFLQYITLGFASISWLSFLFLGLLLISYFWLIFSYKSFFRYN